MALLINTMTKLIIATDPSSVDMMLEVTHEINCPPQVVIEKSVQSIEDSYRLEIDTLGTPVLHMPTITSFISEFEELENIVNNYSLLEEGWDGYDGVAASSDIVESALEVLKKVELHKLAIPSTMLSSSGNIGFYWENDPLYIQINIKPNNKYFEYIEKGDTYYGEDNKLVTQDLSKQLILELS